MHGSEQLNISATLSTINVLLLLTFVIFPGNLKHLTVLDLAVICQSVITVLSILYSLTRMIIPF